MTLNRLLLLPKPLPIHFYQSGLPISTRWCSSSPCSGAQKPDNNVQRHSGSLLNPTNVQNEVKGPWVTVRSIFGNLKAKLMGTPQPQKQNTVEIIYSAAEKTVSEVMKTDDSSQSSEIGRPNHSISMPEVRGDAESCKQNISTGLKSDIVTEKSLTDVLDSTGSNEVKVPKSLDSTRLTEAKDRIHSAADVVFSPKNLVAATVSEGSKSSNDALHMTQNKIMGKSAGQVGSNGEGVDGGYNDVEHGIKRSLVHTLEDFVNSHDKEKRVTETAATDVIHKSSSKDIGQSGVKAVSYTAGYNLGKMSSSSSGPQQVRGLANMFMKKRYGKKDDVITCEKSGDTLASTRVQEVLIETNDKTGKVDTDVISDITHLNYKKKPSESLSITSQNGTAPNNAGLLKKKVRSHYVQESDAKSKESSLRLHELGEIPGNSCRKESSKESKVLVRFLHKDVQESVISKAFQDCGRIMKIQLLPLIRGSNFRDGYVHFETREGLVKALRKSEVFIGDAEVMLEAASLEDASLVLVKNQLLSIPNLVVDPEVPLMLVKNPIRTVMIKQLTHGISSHQLKEALAFCGSGISGIFFGSSSSVAYVEFETEDAKERAIAAYSINVQQKKLLIFRIDVPRTTVIRIMSMIDNTAFSSLMVVGKVTAICSKYGKHYRHRKRGEGILDVYFKLDEWPNMPTILNRLNGMEVEGKQFIAQPAPVFLPYVLEALWSKPDERIHVKSVFRRLLQNNELPVELSDLAMKYHLDK